MGGGVLTCSLPFDFVEVPVVRGHFETVEQLQRYNGYGPQDRDVVVAPHLHVGHP